MSSMRSDRNQEPFRVTSEQRGHAAHLRVFGEIDMATTPMLEGSLRTAESNGYTGIVVDLDRVTFMDAGGVRAFLAAAERAHRDGRTFALTQAPAIVRRVLGITGTTHLLAADAPAFSSNGQAHELPLATRAIAAGTGWGGATTDHAGSVARAG